MAIVDGWPVDRAIAEIMNTGAFGPECEFVSFKLDSRHTAHDQFASTLLYGTVTVRDGRATASDRGLVIKLKHQDPKMRHLYQTDKQFHNEILFYEKIVPFLLASVPTAGGDRAPPACRYFYGRNDCGDHVARDMIVLENATVHGYRSPRSDHRLFLDFDHLVVALRTLAKFHALSYRAKHANPEKFMGMVAAVEETHWCDDGEWIIRDNGIAILFSMVLDKLTERRGGNEDGGTRRFRAELLNDAKRTLRDTMKPVEPLAVLCHGDFNRNNMLFLYDNAERPTKTLAFDMATVRYGSPALDLSFFLYMNTDRRTRDAHWDGLLDVYCAELSAAVSDVADVVRVPDRKQVDVEMRERAFYGLAHVTFFVRVMLEEHNSFDCTQFFDTNGENNLLNFVLSVGGDEATNVIADAVQHYINIRFADVV